MGIGEGMPGAGVYLALGDSITAGYGVGLDKSFATLYYEMLQNCGRAFQYFNLGTNYIHRNPEGHLAIAGEFARAAGIVPKQKRAI